MSIRGRQAALLVVVTVLGVPAFAGAPARAGQVRLFSHSFGAATSTVVDPYPLASSDSAAVDGSAGPSRGDVYVSDAGNNRMEKFDSSGHLILMFGKAVNKTKVEEGKPEAEQNVCLAAEICQPGIAAATPGAFQGFFLFVAVDSSAGSSAGDVYVAETSQEFGARHGLDRVAKFDEDGHLVSSWATAGALDGAGIPNGPFSDVAGIAVDPSGNLWVLDGEGILFGFTTRSIRASEFRQDASPIASWHVPGNPKDENTIEAATGLSIDSSEHFYIVEGGGYVAEWDSTGHRIGAITSPLLNPDTGESTRNFVPIGVSIDTTTGDIYGSGPGAIIRRFDAASCHPSANEHLCSTDEAFGSGRLSPEYVFRIGLAVDPTTALDTVYAAGGSFTAGEVNAFSVETVPDVLTAKASSLTGTSARLNGTVSPSGVPLTKCFFEWGEGEGAYEHEAPCEAPDAAGVGSGGSAVEVHAQISGLTASKTYHFRLVASNPNTDAAGEPSRGQDLLFAPPRVLSTSSLGVGATSATLQSELSANNVETHYHFEYDTVPYAEGEGPHGTSIPVSDASLGSGAAAATASKQIEGLAPSTTYYYRVVATNTLGAVVGTAGSFTTQSAIYGPPLLDGRVWEMVSPPEKSGSSIRGILNEGAYGVLQASADGSGLAYIAIGPFGQEAPGTRSFQDSQFLAFRGASGWSTKDVTTPREDVVGTIPGNTEGYKVFSQDLSFGAVQPRGSTPLSPLATATTPYLRAANGEFLPLVDSLNVPPETVFDGKVDSKGIVENEPEIEGGSPDLHSVVIASCFKLTEDAVNSCGKGNKSLYMWHEGALQLASVLPNEKPAALTDDIANLGESLLKRHAVSDDGTRLAFSTAESKHVYLRDMALGKTVQLDQVAPGAAGGAGQTQFEDMSADGSKVFFTDTARLTTDSNSDNSHPDLYACEIIVQGEALTCGLKDLSVARNPGEPGAVLGESIGMDSTGRYIYFAANGALTPGAASGDCKPGGGTGSGTCGLYLYDTVVGTVKLVATLSDADYRDWADLNDLTGRVSSNGRFVAFVAQRSLTGYDNHDAVSGRPDMEVYLYDRLGDGGEGKLVCASCNPTGGRPHGIEIASKAHSLLNEDEVWTAGTWLAAAIPGWTSYALNETVYQSRYLSDSGRLFFNSADALVPRDSNGTVDVYEYEPPQGEGQPASNSCTSASLSYSSISGGCVDLVSSGTSAEESEFLDASESGDDVFLLTGSQLVPGDFGTAADIYDARVGGVVSEPVKPPACEGDACQSPVSAPEDPTPGSLTFKGPGNPLQPVSAAVKGKAKPSGRSQRLARALKACARRPKRKRAACERQARRAYGRVGKAMKTNKGAHR